MSYIKRAKGFRAKKRLGQNFLTDENIINTIISEADIKDSETVLEIGPGLGFVTEKLAQKAKKVIAVEVDEDAIQELKKLPYENIEIFSQDILKTNLSDLTDSPVKIVANIPYYITTPILVHLLGELDQLDYKNRQLISEIVIMVQYEVAKRMVATEKSPSKEYGLLSILCNYWTIPEFICKVPSKSFFPAPKVDSAVLKLTVRQNPLIEVNNIKLFKKLIKAAFGTRRKTIKNALVNGGFEQKEILNALDKAGIDPIRRGETLSMDEYKKLADILDK